MDGQGKTVKKQFQISLEMEKQDNNLAELHKVIDSLESRLQTITIIEPPSEVNKLSKATEESLVPLAELLKQRNRQIYSAIRRLKSLEQKIEL